MGTDLRRLLTCSRRSANWRQRVTQSFRAKPRCLFQRRPLLSRPDPAHWQRQLLLPARDSYYRSLAHAKRIAWILVLKCDSYWKTLCQTHPVECRFGPRQSLHRGAIFLEQCPSDPLNAPSESPPRIAEEKNLHRHSGANSAKKGFTKVRHHVPISAVDQAHHRFAFIGVLTHRNIEVRHISVERRIDMAILDVEFRSINCRLRRFSARVDVAGFTLFVGRAGDVAARLLHGGFRGCQLAARVGHV